VKPAKWPFRPVHITNDGETYPSKSELNKLNGEGIISNEYLKGILFTIANKLESPIMAMEFSPKEDEVPESIDNVVRTEAISIHFDFHPPCRAFRDYNCGLLCDIIEKKLAKLFQNLTKTELNIEILKQQAYKDESLKDYLDDTEVSFSLKETVGHHYLEFDCPLLGYSNLGFPLFFEDRIVAVLYVGELILQERHNFIKRKQQEFFANHPQCFDEYCKENKENKEMTPESCRQEILDLHYMQVQNKKNVYTKEAYEKLVNKAVKEVNVLEETLCKEMTRKRERYVVERTKNYNRAFYDGLRSKTLLGDEGITILWKLVEEILDEICRDFSFGHIFLFGVNHYTKEYPSELDIAAKAEDMQSKLNAKKRNCKFDLEKIPEEAKNKATHSNTDPQLFKGLPFDLDRNTNFIRTSPVPFSPYSMIITWAGYNSEIWNPSTIDEESGKALESSMRSFISIIASTLSGILFATTKDFMEKTLKIFGHETGQLTSGLDWLRLLYLSDDEKFKRLTKEKADDLNRDIIGYFRQLNFLFEQANMFLSLPEPEKEEFFAYRELLFKWKDIYRLELMKKGLYFDILYYPVKNDPLRPKIWGDPILLEQLLYNLVNNAVKYCYRGTKIQLDCRKQDSKQDSPHILTVINYGLQMEEGRKPYQLFYQGSNAPTGEGLGIGLYIAEKIAIAHGGEINHKCEEVSRYNIFLIKAYLEIDFPKKNNNLIHKLRKEYKRLRKSVKLYEIVAPGKYIEQIYSKLLQNELINSINKPTYKVTFTVTIPAKGEKK
jgi:hypothetical protein